MAEPVRPFRVRIELETAMAPPQTWTQILAELATSDAVHGLAWPARGGPISSPGIDNRGEPVAELLIDASQRQIRRISRPAGWAEGTTSEVCIAVTEAPSGGSLISLWLEGWDGVVQSVVGSSDQELLGWAVDQVLAVTSRAASAKALGDWLTDRLARRPQGAGARRIYQNPETHLPGFTAILEALALGPGDRLLEVGCGGGVLLEQALLTGCTAIGVDHSPEMIRLSHQRNQAAVGLGRLVLLPGEAEALPLPGLWVTAVAMATVFFFLPDPLAVLRECWRVLRPGGRLAVATIPPELRGTPAAPEPMASRGHLHTDQELADLAQAAGFSAVTVHRTANRSQLLCGRRA